MNPFGLFSVISADAIVKPTPGIFVSFPVNSVGVAAPVPVVPVIFAPETPRIARPTVSVIVVVRPIGVPFSFVKV